MSNKIQLLLLFVDFLLVFPLQTNAQKNENITTTKRVTESFDPESLLPKDCGLDNLIRQRRIVGGSVTKKHEFPWMATLGYAFIAEDAGTVMNSASLITNRYLLTAAHVVQQPKIVPVAVWLCAWDQLSENDCVIKNKNGKQISGNVVVGIEEIIIHPDYNNATWNHDIALIRLAEEIEFSDPIRPICLPTDASLDNVVTTAGWGLTGQNSTWSRYLLKINLPRVEHNVCQSAHRRYTISSDRHICAGGEPMKGTCNGDSGGPLMQKNKNNNWTIVGVTSVGPRICGLPGKPGLYTNVFYYRDWILSNLRP